jgi:hypothetical protein
MRADADRSSPVDATSHGRSSDGPCDRPSDQPGDPGGAMASSQEPEASAAAWLEARFQPIRAIPIRNTRRSPSRMANAPHEWKKSREFAFVRGARHPLTNGREPLTNDGECHLTYSE